MHSSIAHFTDAAFHLVTEWTASRSLRDLPYHRMHSGAAAVIRQSGNLLDIASAICSHSNCALGVFSQHRVHSFMQRLCRTANTCKAGLIVGALRIACNGLCTAARFHSAGENSGCLFGWSGGLDCFWALHSMSYLFRSPLATCPGTGECISLSGYLQRPIVQNCPGPWFQFPGTNVLQN